ncbi:hypothetical protein OVA26_15985 [Microbacterium sp. SL62]|uniref:hypothetical protein n=1 Tax=Microbacterium sp. SL62 TaxID=2995139 RepID=UPI002276238D|nr:hypothetical protein [Microbacterium sp. SL62]MCY1718435.1 hypothetical protein [Microbacterium sp. SL62]
MTRSTEIKITITHDSRPPIRRHVHIPADDQVTQDWFDSQTDQSASVRLLVRDEIRRHGMIDRVTRERFGTSVAQRTAGAFATSAPASATPAPAAPTAPVGWVVPGLDPKDVEISRLRGLIAERDSQLASMRAVVEPYTAFLEELDRSGIQHDTLLPV